MENHNMLINNTLGLGKKMLNLEKRLKIIQLVFI